MQDGSQGSALLRDGSSAHNIGPPALQRWRGSEVSLSPSALPTFAGFARCARFRPLAAAHHVASEAAWLLALPALLRALFGHGLSKPVRHAERLCAVGSSAFGRHVRCNTILLPIQAGSAGVYPR